MPAPVEVTHDMHNSYMVKVQMTLPTINYITMEIIRLTVCNLSFVMCVCVCNRTPKEIKSVLLYWFMDTKAKHNSRYSEHY